MSPLKKFGLVAAGIFLVAGVVAVLLAMPRAEKPMPLEYRQSISQMVALYCAVGKDLANDDAKSAYEDLRELDKAANAVFLQGAVRGFSPEQEVRWKSAVEDFHRRLNINGTVDDKTLVGLRKFYKQLSDGLIPFVEELGNAHYQPIYVMHCSMAFNNTGADWLQTSDKLRNPYFGAEMLECGEIKKVIPPGEK